MSASQEVLNSAESATPSGATRGLHTEATPRILGLFYCLAAAVPWFVIAVRPLVVRIVPLVSGEVRRNTRRNAYRIYGHALSRREQREFTRSVVGNFYDFVVDMGRFSRKPAHSISTMIKHTEGESAYHATRRSSRGAVLVTAHMGSYEVGLAALARVEKRIHVVYKRDESKALESLRSRLRKELGVIEAPIDEGLSTWLTLRNALRNDDVVVIQVDRAMPGQQTVTVKFLHGHLRIPTGAIRLARLTGSPIIPVFAVRTASRQFAIYLHSAIEPGTGHEAPMSDDPAVLAIGRTLENMVKNSPTQWLMLCAGFEEDAEHGSKTDDFRFTK